MGARVYDVPSSTSEPLSNFQGEFEVPVTPTEMPLPSGDESSQNSEEIKIDFRDEGTVTGDYEEVD